MSHELGRVQLILQRLESVHGRPRRIARFDPMDELVSCILSQHSSDARSFPAFTRLKERFPVWNDVVEVDCAELADVIRTAGLANQKSKNIQACLRLIYEETGVYSLDILRSMPTMEARAWLLKLPGVGPKTASIVLCFSMGRETIPVDTHVFRVSCRLGLIESAIGEVRAHDALMEIVPNDLSFRFHVDLIQHGRVTCRASSPRCVSCCLVDICPSCKEGAENRTPVRSETPIVRTRRRLSGVTA